MHAFTASGLAWGVERERTGEKTGKMRGSASLVACLSTSMIILDYVRYELVPDFV